MEQLDYLSFPDLETVQNRIKKLKGFRWPQYSIAKGIDNHIREIRDILCENFAIFPNLLYIHSGENELPLNFFRVRPFDTFSDTSLICEYSYKPIHLTTLIQRGNFPYKPVFYCSSDIGTALAEVIKETHTFSDRKYLVSKWSIIEQKNTKIIPFLYSDLLDQNEYHVLGKWALDRLDTLFKKKLSETQVEGLKAYLAFLVTSFVTDNYSVSASLVHSILYAPHNYSADIFIYPSIRSGLKTINMAIHPNFVDNNMKLDRVFSVKVNSIDMNSGECSVVVDKYADLDFKVIMWRDLSPEDEKYKDFIRKDFAFENDFKFNPKN